MDDGILTTCVALATMSVEGNKRKCVQASPNVLKHVGVLAILYKTSIVHVPNTEILTINLYNFYDQISEVKVDMGDLVV